MSPEQKTLLFNTDIGRDPDDLEALLYAIAIDGVQLAGIVTTHMIPHRRSRIARAVLDHLGIRDVPVAAGSTYPLGEVENKRMLRKYLKDHRVAGELYEGKGILAPGDISAEPPVAESTSGVALIHDLIERHSRSLNVAALAPLTDLVLAADLDESHFRQIDTLYIQGSALITDEDRLAPDPSAYNIREDFVAAERIFALQDTIRFVLVGRHAAYQVPLVSVDFDAWKGSKNIIGDYLWSHAVNSLKSFKERAPKEFERIYGFLPQGIDDLTLLPHYSMPYDALVILAAVYPRLMAARQLGRHAIIGATEYDTGVPPQLAIPIQRHIVGVIYDLLRGNKSPGTASWKD